MSRGSFEQLHEHLVAPIADVEDRLGAWAEAAGRRLAAGLIALQRAEDLLEAAHRAADELDDWDGDPSSALGGLGPGGVVRYAAHLAADVEIDTCPACRRRQEAWEADDA